VNTNLNLGQVKYAAISL